MNKSYVVAAKRHVRNSISHDWIDRLRKVEGVEVVGSGPVRAQIRATPAAVEALRKTLGDDFHIEPILPRERM